MEDWSETTAGIGEPMCGCLCNGTNNGALCAFMSLTSIKIYIVLFVGLRGNTMVTAVVCK